MREIKSHFADAWNSGNLARVTIVFWVLCLAALPVGVIVQSLF